MENSLFHREKSRSGLGRLALFACASVFAVSSLAQNHPLTGLLNEKYGMDGKGNRPSHQVMPMQAAPGGEVVFTSPAVRRLGLANSARAAGRMGEQFSLFVDWDQINAVSAESQLLPTGALNPELFPAGTLTGNIFAYSDGSGAQGDGRSVVFDQLLETNEGVMDVGGKGTGPTPYRIPIAEVRSGNHIGEVDGLMSVSEGMTSILAGAYLDALQIKADQMLWMIEIDKTTNHNIELLEIEGESTEIEKAVIGVRAFKNALRLGMIYNGVAGYAVDNGSERNNLLQWIRDREMTYFRGVNRRNFSAEDGFMTGVTRWALSAARAQDMHIVHSAPNRSNLAWGGWTDLNFISGLKNPDPNWGIRSRGPLGLQPFIFFRQLKFYRNFFADEDNGRGRLEVTEAELEKAYWDTFKKEYSRLTLIRMGMTSAQAERVIEQNFEAANAFAAQYWELSKQNLRTDVHAYMIARLQGAAHGQAQRTARRANLDLRDHNGEVTNNGRDTPLSQRGFVTQRIRRVAGEYIQTHGPSQTRAQLNAAEGNELFATLTELAAQAGVTGVEGMAANSLEVRQITMPAVNEFHGEYDKYKRGNDSLQDHLTRAMTENGAIAEGQMGAQQIRAAVNEIYGSKSPYQWKGLDLRVSTDRARRRGLIQQSHTVMCLQAVAGN